MAFEGLAAQVESIHTTIYPPPKKSRTKNLEFKKTKGANHAHLAFHSSVDASLFPLSRTGTPKQHLLGDVR